jgi:hypothetical protein
MKIYIECTLVLKDLKFEKQAGYENNNVTDLFSVCFLIQTDNLKYKI